MAEGSHIFSLTKLHQSAFDFVQKRPYGSLGGDAYVIGDAGLFASGAIGAEPHSVVGGVVLFGAAAIYHLRGGDDKWFAAGCATACLGMAATNYPAISELLTTLQTTQPATLFGTATVFASSAVGAFKPILSQQFQNAKNTLVRKTLGQPRATMGVISAVGKVFMVYDAVAMRDVSFLLVLGTWLLGDFFMGKSGKPRRAHTPRTKMPQPPKCSNG